MAHVKTLILAAAVTAVASFFSAPEAEAGYGYRQSYSRWNYHPVNRYHYSRYNYTVATTTHYHYTVYRPSRPRYVYYYNPRRRVYWGRFDTEKGGYSLLAEKDRKEKLEDIPEEAFPEPGEMPPVPDSDDKESKMLKPDLSTLPKAETAEDAP